MDKVDELLVGLILGFIVGTLFIIFIVNTNGNENIRTDVLDAACQQIYGKEYFWVDNQLGAESQLVCAKQSLPLQIKSQEKIIKLN